MKIPVTRTKELTGNEVLIGLLDYGLFAEKMPPCFTSEGLERIASQVFAPLFSLTDESDLRDGLDKRSHDYMRYESLRDINIPRHLGIPHPESYAIQAMAISRHWPELLTHYGKPTKKVSRIHVRRVGDGRIFEMNYKGADHFQVEEDELRWMTGAQYLVKTDISDCFHSIYTHSIPWALHGRKTSKAKRNLLALSGNLLDKCTQNTRDKQTNGLLTGPHASNILSEIILTSVDSRMLNKRFENFSRHIDDYEFYAATHDEAEQFLHELGLALREYELTINEKKTLIVPLPRPIKETWVRELNRFAFPEKEEIKYSTVRSFLDLALEISQSNGTSAPLNYAIKMMPERLDQRARKMYLQEAINLALAYPYLAPFLDQHVFDKYAHEALTSAVAEFAASLIRLGLEKIYPDAIAHGFYYALKHGITLKFTEQEFLELPKLDDCLVTVLLLEYAKQHSLNKVLTAINKISAALKTKDSRARDRQWLLVYQTLSATELRGSGQSFLATLKESGFSFLRFPDKPNTKKTKTQAPSLTDSK